MTVTWHAFVRHPPKHKKYLYIKNTAAYVKSAKMEFVYSPTTSAIGEQPMLEDFSDRSLRSERGRAPVRTRSPPRRFAPYQPRAPPTNPTARPPAPNYHFQTFCAIRRNAVNVFDSLNRFENDIRDGKVGLSYHDVKSIKKQAAEFLACARCGEVIDDINNKCFVAKCGHVHHKIPVNCWELSGRHCAQCPK